MDYSSTLSNETIIIIAVIIIIIIVIIVLIALFNGNNNNNNNNNNKGVNKDLKSVKILDTKEKLDLIISNQDKQMEIISDVFNTISDLSTNKEQVLVNNKDKTLYSSEFYSSSDSSEEKNNSLYSSKINLVDNNDTLYSSEIDLTKNQTTESFNETFTQTNLSKTNDLVNNETFNDTNLSKTNGLSSIVEEVYYHEESLNNSEIEKLYPDTEKNNIDPISIDFQHESYSDTTESFEGKSIDDPSMIKKHAESLGLTNINNQKFPVKDKSPVKKTTIPLPKSVKIETILNSDLSSPDDETILRVNKKIPLPKAYQKVNKINK